MSEVYAAMEPLLRVQEIKNLENKFTDSLSSEGVKDVRSQLRENALTNPTPFWNANNRQAWVYGAYRNLLKDRFRYETRRNPELLQKMMLKYNDEIQLLKQRHIETNEDLSGQIVRLEEKQQSLVELRNEMDDIPRKVISPEVGCATFCLEKLAQEDPKRYALFAAKVLDHSPEEIETVARGVLQKNYNPFEGIGKMLNQLKEANTEIVLPSTTEAQVANLLAQVFGYASGNAVNATISQIRKELQNCVIGCEQKHSQT